MRKEMIGEIERASPKRLRWRVRLSSGEERSGLSRHPWDAACAMARAFREEPEHPNTLAEAPAEPAEPVGSVQASLFDP